MTREEIIAQNKEIMISPIMRGFEFPYSHELCFQMGDCENCGRCPLVGMCNGGYNSDEKERLAKELITTGAFTLYP